MGHEQVENLDQAQTKAHMAGFEMLHHIAPAGEIKAPEPLKREVPWEASPRTIDQSWMSVSDWKKRVSQLSHLPARERAQVVFIGDSITEGWPNIAPQVWNEFFKKYQALALGIGGDQTQNVLWRMDQGELRGLKPAVVVVLIGVNNIWWGGFSPSETAQGIAAVIKRISQELKESHIIVHPIFPAGKTADDALRERTLATNSALNSLMPKESRIHLMDIGRIFLDTNDTIDSAIMEDFVHLTAKGYKLWALALRDTLRQLIPENAPARRR